MPHRAWRGHFRRGNREETRSRPSNHPRPHRRALKQFTDWNDGQPETELNFEFYRQARTKSSASRMKRWGFPMVRETPCFGTFRRRTNLIAEG
jgi:hypothetical protein